jgi:hypothetical protein
MLAIGTMMCRVNDSPKTPDTVSLVSRMTHPPYSLNIRTALVNKLLEAPDPF